MYFVYRSHYEGPLSKHVRRLPDQTVLDWFRRGWAAPEPDGYVEAELGIDVYGLHTIFDAAREENLPVPQTTGQLRALLHEHLYVEGDEDYIRLDDHSLRVRTDDDEVELAYFFLDDHVAAAAPERLTYLLHESWPLPDDSGASGRFHPAVRVTPVADAGTGEATTYAVLLTHYDGETLARQEPLGFTGVALPELTQRLQSLDSVNEWPMELAVLRALIAPGEQDLGQALQRCNRWPAFNLNAHTWPTLPDAHQAAHEEATQLLAAAEFTAGRRPEASLLRVGAHAAQLAMHCNEAFGFQQWYLFDTVWAASHPDLAQSLLRYAGHWDPLEG